MNTVVLDKNKHDRKDFDCGIVALNNYLKIMANQQAKKDNTRTFVLEHSQNPSHIVGFYTLTTIALDFQGLPDEMLRKRHQQASASGLIARLAIDKRYQGDGIGEWLLTNALRRLLFASDNVAFPIVVVDAKDGARAFYEKYAFRGFSDSSDRLFVTIANVRATLHALNQKIASSIITRG